MIEDPTVSAEPEPKPKPRDGRALNAYRHGLTGQVLILTPEDQAAYLKHSQGIQESLAPSGAMETDIAQSIADDRWRLKHAAAMEAAIFALGIEAARPFTGHPEIDAAYAQATTWLKDGKSIALLSLYESRIQRRVEKNLATLRQLQQDRQAALQQAVEQAQLLAQLAANKGESYDIERDFPSELLPRQSVCSRRQIARLAAVSRRLAEAKKQCQAPQKSLRHAA